MLSNKFANRRLSHQVTNHIVIGIIKINNSYVKRTWMSMILRKELLPKSILIENGLWDSSAIVNVLEESLLTLRPSRNCSLFLPLEISSP